MDAQFVRETVSGQAVPLSFEGIFTSPAVKKSALAGRRRLQFRRFVRGACLTTGETGNR
jgi:hypothetical protein